MGHAGQGCSEVPWAVGGAGVPCPVLSAFRETLVGPGPPEPRRGAGREPTRSRSGLRTHSDSRRLNSNSSCFRHLKEYHMAGILYFLSFNFSQHFWYASCEDTRMIIVNFALPRISQAILLCGTCKRGWRVSAVRLWDSRSPAWVTSELLGKLLNVFKALR